MPPRLPFELFVVKNGKTRKIYEKNLEIYNGMCNLA